MSSANDIFVQQLREASSYFKQLHGSKIAFCISPEQLEERPALLQDLVLLRTHGARVIVVLDSRAALADLLGRDSFRAQNRQPLSAVELEAAKGLIDRQLAQLASGLQRALASAHEHRDSAWLLGSFAYARNRGVLEGVDMQRLGQVRNVNAKLLQQLSEHILLFGQVLPSQSGEYYLVDSFELLQRLARAASLDKAIIFGAVPEEHSGCAWQPSECTRQLEAQPDDHSREPLRVLAQLCASGASKRAYLIDSATDGAILLELLTANGAGIMITSEHYEQLRPASVEDINQIMQLAAPLVDSGKLRPRDASVLEREIGNFVIASRDHETIGCVALRPWEHQPGWAELECLAVADSARGRGLGQRLLQAIEQRARKLGFQVLVLLTTQSMGWFAERGFVPNDGAGVDLDRVDKRCRSAQIMIKPLA